MSSIRKLVMTLGVLFASSSLLVSCSDDDYPNMGAIVVNSLQTTSNSATAYWTVVSNGSCDGYKVVINEGTREQMGAEVVNQTFKPKEYTATFKGLKPNTTYVITTQGIPSASSGRDQADTYELQFMTAPLVSGIAFGEITYTDVTVTENGVPVTYKKGTTTITWNEIASNNCGGYTADLQLGTLDSNNQYAWSNVTSITLGSSNEVSAKFTEYIDPEKTYRVRVRPNPRNGCWYASGEYTISNEVTAPAAQ